MGVKNAKKSLFYRCLPIQSNFLGFSGAVEENTLTHVEVLLPFLSLIYGADLGRSQLVYLSETS